MGGGGEEVGSAAAGDEEGEEPEGAEGWWWAAPVAMALPSSSSSSEISMSSPEEWGDACEEKRHGGRLKTLTAGGSDTKQSLVNMKTPRLFIQPPPSV